jgi:Major Facilitator Superfamily
MRLPWADKNQHLATAEGISDSNTPSTNDDSTTSDQHPINKSAAPALRSGEDGTEGVSEIKEKHETGGDVTTTEDEKQSPLGRTVSAASTTSAGEPGEDDESKYPKPVQLYALTFGLAMSTFVIALDNTIIATAIPRITTVFNSLGDVGWYGSAYLLTTTSLQPSFGKVYTYFNIKWTYISAIVIFELGSILCAAALTSTMLIVGRAVAGVGAAAIFSGGMTIVGYSVPLRKRPIYIGLLSSMFGISSVIGPILGGALTDSKHHHFLPTHCQY